LGIHLETSKAENEAVFFDKINKLIVRPSLPEIICETGIECSCERRAFQDFHLKAKAIMDCVICAIFARQRSTAGTGPHTH